MIGARNLGGNNILSNLRRRKVGAIILFSSFGHPEIVFADAQRKKKRARQKVYMIGAPAVRD